MSRVINATALSSPLARTIAIAALMGSTVLASPLSPAFASSATSPPAQLHARMASATSATHNRGESVEQRITSLHASLKITPAEDAKWNSVAQAMRDNAASMDKLVATTRTKAPQDMTALDDLNTYQEFAEAHVANLKNLTSAFASLYDSMPAAQKKNADEVFHNFGRHGAAAHS